MSRSRVLLTLLFCLQLGVGVAAAPRATAIADTGDATALVLVRVPDNAAIARFEQTGLSAYVHFRAADDAYLLAAADADGWAGLLAAGLSIRRLLARPTDGPFYLVYPAPGRSLPAGAWPDPPLFADERVALLAASAERAESLAAAGADIVHIPLAAISLHTAPDRVAAFPPVTIPDPVIAGMVDAVQQSTLYQYIGDLSGEWQTIIRGSPYTIATRHTRSGTPIRQAVYYAGDHLAARGLAVEYHEWNIDRPANVIGELAGQARPDDIYMITAHLDDMPSGMLAPGADDNASGSAAVLVAADILSQYRWDCTLRFALWTGEEQGLLGSQAYAAQGERILGVLNLDMIGWNTPGSSPDIDLHARATMPATVELANQFASVVAAYGLNLIPEVLTNGTGASDHASFWNAGYTAILGIEDYYPNNHDFSPYYHQTTDRLATLDMAYLTEYVKASVAATAHMSGCLDRTPAAPTASIAQVPAGVAVSWQHVLPNVAYALHRGTAPWFAPGPDTLLTAVAWPFPAALAYEDAASGIGDPALNHFYVVLGLNEAGDSAASRRVGEFDFALVTP